MAQMPPDYSVENVSRMIQPSGTAGTTKWIHSPLFAALCIILLGAAIYGNTLQVPWYFDDIQNIVRNPAIRDLNGSWHGILAPRGLAMFSFALNYHFHGLELPGYHVVNILIHLLTTFLVYLNLKRVFRNQPFVALLAALIFLSHPLQTQPVTYIVQRMTSLSALFFFLSLYCYVRARESLLEGHHFLSPPHLLFYLLSLASGAVAVYTKQNAAILPVCLFLFDRFFLPKQKQGYVWLILYLLPYFAAPVWMALTQIVFPVAGGRSLAKITATQDMAKGLEAVKKADAASSPLAYLVTEFSVLWLYIRLLFLPYGQVLDYNYPLATVLLTTKNALSFFGLAGLLAFATVQRKRLPLVSFSVFWFFIALSVESSIIPLDAAFEHRLYVPMFGFAILLPHLLGRFCRNKHAIVILCVMVAVYSLLTVVRNDLWSRESDFFEDQLSKVPQSTRAMISLSKIYLDKGRDQDSETLLRKVIQFDRGNEKAYINLSSILVRKQRVEEALQVLQQGLQVNPFSPELHNNLGVLYDQHGMPELAIKSLFEAISLNPGYAESYTNLGAVYAGLSNWKDAEKYYRKGLSVLHENPKAHYNLGVALYYQKRLPESAESFRLSLKFAPEDADALFNLANVLIELDNNQAALDLLPRLRVINPGLAIKVEQELSRHKSPLPH